MAKFKNSNDKLIKDIHINLGNNNNYDDDDITITIKIDPNDLPWNRF